MPRKRKKPTGGQVTHGIPYWLRTRRIHSTIAGAEKIQAYLMELERQLIVDQGGPESLTTAREILVRSTIKAYGVVLLSELFISKYSPLRPDKLKKGILQYHPILEKSYFSHLAQIRSNLLALGLGRVKSKRPIDINVYLEAKRKARKGEELTQDASEEVPPSSGPGEPEKPQGEGNSIYRPEHREGESGDESNHSEGGNDDGDERSDG